MTDDVTDRLARCSTASLATVLLRRGLERVFMHGVRPLPFTRPRLVGRAFTMRGVASRADKLAEDRARDPRENIQRRAAEECGVGEVLVIDCHGDATGSSGGMILLERMRIRGCAGVVTDGGMRDAADLAETGFPVYAKAVCPPSSLVAHRFVELGVPISCGGVAVYPGDLIVGDNDGVIVVPEAIAADVANECLAVEDEEEFILRRIRSGAEIFGTYPLAGEALASYRAETARTERSGE